MPVTGEIAATEFNNGGEGINWDDTNFSLYPWWIGSVSEAVFLLGAERNADKIIGTTYVSCINPPYLGLSINKFQAPFLMNLDSYQWSPTMISFDSNPDNTAKSTSWHVYDVSQQIERNLDVSLTFSALQQEPHDRHTASNLQGWIWPIVLRHRCEQRNQVPHLQGCCV